MEPETLARLLVTCPDRPGIVAAVTGFLYRHGVNITDLDQHSSDASGGTFFLRLEFQTPGLDVGRAALSSAFGEAVARPFGMDWRLSYAVDRPRMAILVSRHEHAALELLWRWQRRELPVDIPVVISNHPELRSAVEAFGVPFEHIPVIAGDPRRAERQLSERLDGQVEFLVLARYMRILGSDFVSRWPARIINIHHSFLPAFVGAEPYRQAWEHGVKLIGATAHYVTAELDQGPIIEQDTVRVTHRKNAIELKRLGADLERQVLARAVRWHVESRVIVDGNKTVVFS